MSYQSIAQPLTDGRDHRQAATTPIIVVSRPGHYCCRSGAAAQNIVQVDKKRPAATRIMGVSKRVINRQAGLFNVPATTATVN
jgi:hypothetical protein